MISSICTNLARNRYPMGIVCLQLLGGFTTCLVNFVKDCGENDQSWDHLEPKLYCSLPLEIKQC
jgi:hypothetical protein